MADEHSNLMNEVARKLGVNILLFQKIEKGLKVLLPFIAKPDSADKKVKDIRIQKEVLQSQTLGQLINSFVESVDCDSDYFLEYLKRIVEDRNKLVHHFGGSKGINVLSTEKGCRTCLSELEEQRREAYAFYEVVQSFILVLYENISDKAEYVNLKDPSGTVWASTKIVKLLRLAEAHTTRVDGMTSLSKAGKYIKSQDLECTPKRYGIKTLKGILKASALFEVIEDKGGYVLYKSKTPLSSIQKIVTKTF